MIEEQAVVVSLEGDRALLEIERSQPCGLCGATRGCGVSLWGRLFSRRRGSISTTNALNVGVGDHVVIGVEEGALLAGSLVAYLLPLVLVCAGGMLGATFAATRAAADLYGALGALAGLGAGLAWMRLQSARRPDSGRFQPVMLRRAETVSIRQCAR
jgi:sigma-E factor negative regulatory protein RseC